jgi:hypothetical protein
MNRNTSKSKSRMRKSGSKSQSAQRNTESQNPETKDDVKEPQLKRQKTQDQKNTADDVSGVLTIKANEKIAFEGEFDVQVVDGSVSILGANLKITRPTKVMSSGSKTMKLSFENLSDQSATVKLTNKKKFT